MFSTNEKKIAKGNLVCGVELLWLGAYTEALWPRFIHEKGYETGLADVGTVGARKTQEETEKNSPVAT